MHAQLFRIDAVHLTPVFLLFCAMMTAPRVTHAQTMCAPGSLQQVLAADGAPTDAFGLSVAIDGDIAVLGAIWDDDRGFNSGSVYIYERTDNGQWLQTRKITPTDGGPEDVFGRSVAISGQTIVVGANGDDDRGFDAGAGYVYVRQDGQWIQQAKLRASDGRANDRAGWAIDIHGDTVVLSAHRRDDAGIDSGAAYVFVRNESGQWTQQARLNASDAAADDLFGHDVAVDGDTIIVGAYKDDDDGSSSGSAYIFTRDASNQWLQQAKLTASDANVGYHFGRFVDLDGNRALIGSPFHHPLNYGAAYIFEQTGGIWTQRARFQSNPLTVVEWFGGSVAIKGDRVLIGSFYGQGTHPGEAVLYQWNGSAWMLQDEFTLIGGNNNDGFGRAVALTDDALIIGASGDDDQGVDAGSAFFINLECPDPPTADINQDGRVDHLDFFSLLQNWGPCPGSPSPCPWDFTGLDDVPDGFVNESDFMALLQRWDV